MEDNEMSKRPAIRVILSIVAGIFSLSLALDSWASSCGDSFHGPGHFTLNSDVGPCSGPNFAIEVHGPATLDMAGHIVSCDGNPSSIGIFILGDNVTVKGG